MLRMIIKPAHTQISPGSSRGLPLRLIAITSLSDLFLTAYADVLWSTVLYAKKPCFVTAKALRLAVSGL